MQGTLILEDGTRLEGTSFGCGLSGAGEVVFTTGMVGYPESLTDPSYGGQILVMTYPLVGNYGVQSKITWESEKIWAAGLIVSSYIDTPSHFASEKTLSTWLKEEKIPALEIKDTRFLAKKIRNDGVMRGKIVIDQDINFIDPNKENLVARVSMGGVGKEPVIIGSGKKTIVVIDCGVKNNTLRNFVRRGWKVIRVPWNYDPFKNNLKFDALFISNGPGDPKTVVPTVNTVKTAIENKIPIFGICLGNQVLALAAGGDTYKLKFGHRGQNQPCLMSGTRQSFLTTQNHGYAVGKIPTGFKEWFSNANDGTNEGIIHTKYPFMSVQFHPESFPGPLDTEWIFDYFLEKVK